MTSYSYEIRGGWISLFVDCFAVANQISVDNPARTPPAGGSVRSPKFDSGFYFPKHYLSPL